MGSLVGRVVVLLQHPYRQGPPTPKQPVTLRQQGLLDHICVLSCSNVFGRLPFLIQVPHLPLPCACNQVTLGHSSCSYPSIHIDCYWIAYAGCASLSITHSPCHSSDSSAWTMQKELLSVSEHHLSPVPCKIRSGEPQSLVFVGFSQHDLWSASLSPQTFTICPCELLCDSAHCRPVDLACCIALGVQQLGYDFATVAILS